MTELSSTDLQLALNDKGIPYGTAKQLYYRDYPYRVLLSSRFQGLSGSKHIGCRIDIADIERARQRLNEFVDRVQGKIQAVEDRAAIIDFIDAVCGNNALKRLGGEYGMIYFKDAGNVLSLCERFPADVTQVTGPTNERHRQAQQELASNVVVKDRLFFGRYRYQIQYIDNAAYVEYCYPLLKDALENIDPDSWRGHRLDAEYRKQQHQRQRPAFATYFGSTYGPRKSIVFFENGEDFVLIKMLTAEYIHSTQEIMLVNEFDQ